MLGRKFRQARRRLFKTRLGVLLAVVGPGIITAFGGNDASGIYGYSLAGAQYRYALLWMLALTAISLGVCQEMCARMGAVTGKGLADLIREEYGVKITLVAMLALLVANFATTVSEFAGITRLSNYSPRPGRAGSSFRWSRSESGCWSRAAAIGVSNGFCSRPRSSIRPTSFRPSWRIRPGRSC